MSRPVVTRSRLISDLAALGVGDHSAVMVHTSLSAIGWIVGGAPTLVDALLSVLGANGTLLVLTGWEDRPPYHQDDWDDEARTAYRNEGPVFDPRTCRAESDHGRLPEAVRTWSGAAHSITRSTPSPRSARTPPGSSRVSRSMRATAPIRPSSAWSSETELSHCSAHRWTPSPCSTTPSTSLPVMTNDGSSTRCRSSLTRNAGGDGSESSTAPWAPSPTRTSISTRTPSRPSPALRSTPASDAQAWSAPLTPISCPRAISYNTPSTGSGTVSARELSTPGDEARCSATGRRSLRSQPVATRPPVRRFPPWARPCSASTQPTSSTLAQRHRPCDLLQGRVSHLPAGGSSETRRRGGFIDVRRVTSRRLGPYFRGTSRAHVKSTERSGVPSPRWNRS